MRASVIMSVYNGERGQVLEAVGQTVLQVIYNENE